MEARYQEDVSGGNEITTDHNPTETLESWNKQLGNDIYVNKTSQYNWQNDRTVENNKTETE